MVIEVTYNVTDVYMSTTVSPIYITVDYSGSGGSGASSWGSITGTLSNQTDLQTALDGKFDDPTGTTTEYIDGTGALQTFPLTLPVLQQVRNQTGATLAAGTVVYISGATGNLPTVSKAIATGDSTSAQTLGMISAAISNNGTGYVVVIGTCSGLDTSAYTEGQQLYLSGTTAGAVTTTKPYAPIHLVYIGIVTRAHPTLGTIEVRVQNGFELEELHDVDALNPSNNDGLFYNSGNELWEHKPISTVLGYTPEQPLTFSSPLSRSTNTVSIPAASSSANGYLSSTDWSTFNSKQNALTNPVTGTGTSNELAYFSGTSAISSLTTATYPSLTELSYVKGVTSALQTQLNAKQGTITLTTTGTSGAATLVGNTLNIPQYSGGGGGGMAIGGSITSATAGSVLFAGTSGVLAQNNANFFWDNTNQFLGIGLNNPSHKLHVNGTGRFTSDLYLNLTTSSITFIGASGIVTQDNSNFIWDNTNKRLGIGISTPTGRLHAYYANFSDVAVFERAPSFTISPAGSAILRTSYASSPSDGAGPTFSFQIKSGGTINDIASFGAIRNGADNSGALIFNTFTSGTQTEKMRIFSNGNTLIQNGGTFTDAGFRLDVNGTMRVQSKMSLSAGTTSNAQINLASSTAPTSPNNGDIWFDGTDIKMRIGGVTKTFTLV